MNCTYCGTRNVDEDHRCKRCGRRLGLNPTPVLAGSYQSVQGSAAPRLDERQAVPGAVAEAALAEPQRPPRQKSLFPQPVLRFEEYAPMEKRPRRRDGTGDGVRRPPRRRRSRKLERLEKAGQQRLPLETPMPALPPETKSGVPSAKCCTEKVASPVHRLLAALIDGAIVASGLVVVFAMFYGAGGVAALESLHPAVFALAGVGVLALYKALWWLADGDSPGMACCNLRLLNFTGRRPNRAQRAHRFAATCLSLAAAGLGLLWALGDEERLCWNDHL